ncbi:MAG: 23S rRNA (adenine(2503)-C(2))-methyltransferase RlmN [Acutalibacteraceae bacterium]
MNKTDIKSMTIEELTQAIVELKQPKFRTGQVYSWLHQKNVESFDEMTNLSKELRKTLDDNFELLNCSIEKKLVSEYNDTIKYLFKLNDGEYIESVVMKYKYGYTICISTQVGCKMKCSFCASALDGFFRNLEPSEMLAQVYKAQKDLGIRISHIVLMGMGEPLDNYDNVIRFLDLITNDKGVNIGARHISLSTCGIVPKIYELQKQKLQITLSVSLHAPSDEIRTKIMPVNLKWGVDELLEACRSYTSHTSRRISFEYAMINGVNDTDECANLLALKLKGMLCHINLIPANEVKENDYIRSTNERLMAFSKILESKGITVTVRRSMGGDIDASCGQLRRGYEKGGNGFENSCKN